MTGRAWVAAVGALASAVVPLLPWASSGQAVRSGYEVVRVARSSGAVPALLGVLAVAGMALLPVLAGGAVAGGALRRARLVGILAVMAGSTSTLAALAVHLAPLGAEAGLWAATVTGPAVTAAGVWAAR